MPMEQHFLWGSVAAQEQGILGRIHTDRGPQITGRAPIELIISRMGLALTSSLLMWALAAYIFLPYSLAYV